MKRQILFLGVTNTCASRFAEVLFNHLASEQQLSYHSVSRGIMVRHQDEPIDPRTINALAARGILMSAKPRGPVTLNSDDLKDSDYIVLVSGNELVHRLERAKGMENKQILTWDFEQVNKQPVHALYPALEAEVFLLVRRLQLQRYPESERITA